MYVYINIYAPKYMILNLTKHVLFVPSRQRLPPHKYTNRAGLLVLYTETSVTVSSGLIPRRSLTIICYIIGIMAEFIACLQRMRIPYSKHTSVSTCVIFIKCIMSGVINYVCVFEASYNIKLIVWNLSLLNDKVAAYSVPIITTVWSYYVRLYSENPSRLDSSY